MMQLLHGAYMIEVSPGSNKELLSIKGDEIIHLHSRIIANDNCLELVIMLDSSLLARMDVLQTLENQRHLGLNQS